MLPPGLASLAGQHQMPPASSGGGDQLQVLQDTIEGLPPLIHALHDPTDVNDAVKALHILTGIQKRLMGQAGGPAPAQR